MNANSLPESHNPEECECNAGFSGENGGVCDLCAANTLKLISGPSPCFECETSRFSRCLCKSNQIAYQEDWRSPVSLQHKLQQLKGLLPVIGSDLFFNACVDTRDLHAARSESAIDCSCFGWGEDGFDMVSKMDQSPSTVLQKYHHNGPWQDIPCYQRRAADGTEWQHSVDKKTCDEVKTQLLTNHQLCDWEYAGFCCECHGLDARFHANPMSPWFDETFDEQCSDIIIPVATPVPITTKTVEIVRSWGDDDAGWIRLDLQYAAIINEVKIEFDLKSVFANPESTREESVEMLWRALKHYEIQIGNSAEMDANPVYAQYNTQDETFLQCKDCQSELISVDPDLLMWLQFDDPSFIGKDSSNYQSDARIMTQTLPVTNTSTNTLAVYQNPTAPLESAFGPMLWGSLVLDNANYLEMGFVHLAAQSDLTISLWFVGMIHPSPGRKHVIFEMSSEDGASFVRVEQNWHRPAAITTVLTVQESLALYATNRDALTDLMYTPASAPVVVGEWNHYTLSVNTNQKTAFICLNSECMMLSNGVQANDGDTYNVRGMGTEKLVLRSRMNDGAIAYCPRTATPQYSYACYQGQLDEIRVYRRAMTIDEIQKLSIPRASVLSDAIEDEIWQKYAHIEWFGENLVIQQAIPHVKARYVLLKFPVCDYEKLSCNTHHRIPIAQIEIDRQRWHFDHNSTWSWSGDTIPSTSSQEPWLGGKGLCFQHDVSLFSHREFLENLPLFVEMDFSNIKPLSGFVFTYVPGSTKFGQVRVYYDIEPQFMAQSFQIIDLSTLNDNDKRSVEMYFHGDPVRV